MTMDFNDAEAQREFDVIPNGTVVPLIMVIRPGGVGDGAWAKASKTSDAVYLDCEFTVTAGPYINRKFWQNLTIGGGKVNEKGESIAWNITKSTIRAMLNSARGVKPDDDSELARKARVINTFGDLNTLEFIAKLKVDHKDKAYPPKNQMAQVIEPGHQDYTPDAFTRTAAAAAAPAAPAPAWARGNGNASTPNAPAAAEAARQGNLPAWAR